mmetsp:Transcript_3513/g.4128  ORF Transcript_3513/g.4128 Transcript_3513/m.4128 type:complete len:148 (+) Transcript_3513:468-911(+)
MRLLSLDIFKKSSCAFNQIMTSSLIKKSCLARRLETIKTPELALRGELLDLLYPEKIFSRAANHQRNVLIFLTKAFRGILKESLQLNLLSLIFLLINRIDLTKIVQCNLILQGGSEFVSYTNCSNRAVVVGCFSNSSINRVVLRRDS